MKEQYNGKKKKLGKELTFQLIAISQTTDAVTI